MNEKLLDDRMRELKELVGPTDWPAVEEGISLSTQILANSLSENPEPGITFDSKEELERTVRHAVVAALIELAKENKLDASSPEQVLQRIGDRFVNKWIEIVRGVSSSGGDYIN